MKSEPEELFPLDKPKKIGLKPSKTQEVVIMVGYPGSGKSKICGLIFEPAGYFIAHGDELKTSAKMIKASITPITEGKSVVFDATNASKKKRAEYIEFAEKYKMPVRCVHVNTSLADSMARNNLREKPVPRIVYNIYNKNFETPSEDEGFTLVTI